MSYEEFFEEWRNRTDVIICHTSGSTGIPKLIQLPKKFVRESAERTISFFGLSKCSHLHSCISPDYIGGKMMAVRSDVTGAELTYETPSNRPLSDYSGGPIDLLAVVPSQMIHILDNLKQMPEIRNVIIGGAPIPDSLCRRIASSGINAFETYGMTETASHIALRKVAYPRVPFVPLPGIRISCDKDSRLNISIGEDFSIITNDIVNIHSDGSFSISGRADNVIITGGKKVHPEKVEEILEEKLGCPVLITSLPDSKWGEKVIMMLEDDNHHDNETIKKICKENLSPECVPKEILHKNIELTPNGKKKRRFL